MKYIPFLLSFFLLVSCNVPSQPIATETLTSATLTPIIPTETSTSTPTPSPTLTPIPPSNTPTPIPCDPLTTAYCITDGHFLFQRPILPPGNDMVDLTYLYGTTQNGKRDPHHGVEFQNAFGTPVHAGGDGTVVFADSDKVTKFSTWNNFYGNVVLIHHANDFYTLYAHLSQILVKVGDEVKAGDVIGAVGQSGAATGSHLHFEVRRGGDGTDYFSTENPEVWLIPKAGTGAISITLKMNADRNYELPLVITRYAENSDDELFVYYITSYTKGFEHNAEDAALESLPPGRYKVAFTDAFGLHERMVMIEAGKLTEVVFQ